MAHFPDYMPASEKRVVNKLLTRILDAGYTISVYDGEEYALRKSRDRAAIQRETAATEATTYVIHRGDDRLGSIWLVHGNGDEVISDSSWNHNIHDAEAIIDALTRED